MKLTPIRDQVLVELDPQETEFGDSGIARPENAHDKPMWGTVVGVGPGKDNERGHFIPTELHVGDRVFVPWSTGQDLTIGGKPHVFIRERLIEAIEVAA